MKKMIAKLLLMGTLCMSVSSIYASPILDKTQSLNECKGISCDNIWCYDNFKNSGQIRALLIDQEVNFNGEGSAYFRYDSGYLRFYMENLGEKPISYKVSYPCGCKLVSGNLAKGEHDLLSSLDPELHGHNPVGQYHVYVSNADGSRGTFKVSARSLEK